MNSKESKKMIDWVVGRCRRCSHGWLKRKGEDMYCEDCSIKLVDEDWKLKRE